MNKRNRILAAALGLVATAGAFDTVENFAILGNENGGARPIVLEPTDGAYKSPTGRKAFLVAADDYGETVNKLPCTKNDLKALKERLEKLGFTTTVLQSDAGPSNAPTKAIIERRFKRFVESLESGDFAIVYLSGHGIQPTNSQEAFFVPVDFDEHDVFETSVSIDDMLVALKESNATFRWTIVDACRDDPTAEASAFKGASKSLGAKTLGGISAVPDSVALLQSCQPGKRSYEGGSLGAEDIENGFFTLSLLEALDENDSKADANEDGVLTFLEMSDYVSRRTNELARTRYGCEQVPNLNGSITNFALLDDLLIDGISKAEWNRADGLYQEACALRRQRRWRDALAKIGAARRINGKRKEYEDAEAEIQAQVDSVAASEKRAEADKLANDAWAAFDLGGEANVEKAIQLMKQSLKLVESVGNRRVLKTFEEELEAIRNPSLSPERLASTASQDSQERPQSSETSETSGESSSTASSSEASGDWSGSYEAGTAKSLDIKGVKYTFRYCPAGTFTMGSSVSEKDRASDETQHKVTLTKDFWLLETEVTQAMWESVIGENPSFFSSDLGSALKARGADEGKLNSDDLAAFTASLLKARGVDVGEPSEGILTAIAATLLKFSDMNTSNFPVDWVNWENCQKFVEKLNAGGYAPEGLVFRLPTEAEWEYACRAGTTTPFFWGTSLNGDKANCDGTEPYGTSTNGEYLEQTTEVGSCAPNAWGLYDMHGNVQEWCWDWYGAYDASSQTDPMGPSSGEYRVLRGGCWGSSAVGCRSANRDNYGPMIQDRINGVRIVLGPALPEESPPASSQSSGATEKVVLNITPPASGGTRRALLIGVSDYLGFMSCLSSLFDVRALRERLIENGFEPENVVALTTDEGPDKYPFKYKIERELERLCEEAKPDDVVFVYFTGHGYVVDGRDYFLPMDVGYDGGIYLDVALNEIARCGARYKFCLINAGRETLESLDWVVKDAAPILSENAESMKNCWTLYGGAPGEALLDFPNPKENGSLLTRAFLEGTTELGDADGDGVVTVMEACRYAMKKTTENAEKYFGETQTPYLNVGVDDVDFALILNPKKAEKKEENATQGEK